MEKNDTPKSFISERALKCLIRLSGLHHEFIAKKIGITPNYFWMILNGKRKAPKKREEIYKFVMEVKTLVENLAA